MKKTVYTLCVLFFALQAMAQNGGDLNNNFGTNGYQWIDVQSKDQVAGAIAVQPDGKVIVAGMHEHTANKTDWLIYRLGTNGLLDLTFSTDGRVTESFSDKDVVTSVAVRPNGKILIAGYSETNSNGRDIMLMQLESDGSIDNNFGTNGVVQLDPSIGADDYAMSVHIAPSGKIYVGGFMQISGEGYLLAYRLNANGSTDNSFSLNGYHFVDMDAPAAVYDASLAADGSFFLAGATIENQKYKMFVAKFKSNGNMDDDFAGDGVKVFQPALNTQAYLKGVAALPNGGVIAVGVQANNGTDNVIIQLNSSGLLDPGFNGNGIKVYSFYNEEGFTKIKRLANGKYLVLGEKELGNNKKNTLYQFNTDGSLDNTYANGAGMVNITISAGDEEVVDLAVNNNYAYTIGTYTNGSHTDMYVSSTTVTNPIGVEELTFNSGSMKIFPNPVTGKQDFNVLLDDEISGNVNISVLSITGEVVYEVGFYKASSQYNHPISTSNLARGVYLVKIENNGKAGTQKLIVQ